MIKLSKQLISSLNLTEAEASVYLAALELGQANMQQLARKSGVKRTSIYNFIDDLKERHLVTETKKNNRSLYSATSPERLVEIEKARLQELNETLPQLMAIQNAQQTKPKVTFHEGFEAVEEIYEEFIKEGKPIIAWSEFNESHQATGTLMEEQAVRRSQKGIPVQWITTDTPEAHEFAKHDNGLLRDTKYVKTDKFKTKIVVYGNKLALLSYHADPPYVVLIEDADIASTVKGLWEELWQRLD